MSNPIEAVKEAKLASVKMAALTESLKNGALKKMAEALDKHRLEILSQNAEDMQAAEGKLSKEMLKRLLVTDSKIDEMIRSIESVISCEDPIGKTISSVIMDDNLTMYQVRCPIGLVGIIFESRPDVIPQIISLCLKTGNAVCFKGGQEAKKSNKQLFDILINAISSEEIPKKAFVLLESREDIKEILSMDKEIDLLVPRGSYEFVRYIQDNTKIPVLGHSAGVCHVYVDEDADIEKALRVTLDSKVQYPAVCNAAETLLINEKIAQDFLPKIVSLLIENGVEIRIMDGLQKLIHGVKIKIATDEDWFAEYDDLIISIRTVKDVCEASEFINAHGSHHSEQIITENRKTFDYFMRNTDSADILLNASTRFADGYRLGLGAEIGISTGKIHARGPMGLEGLTIYKYVVIGNGDIVQDYQGDNPKKKFKHKRSEGKYGE